MSIQRIYVVEISKVVEDLEDYWRYSKSECDEVCFLNFRSYSGWEERSLPDEKGSDFDPGDDVMNDPRAIQQCCGRRKVPSIAAEVHEAKCAMRGGKKELD
jgi:hypothetical protein